MFFHAFSVAFQESVQRNQGTTPYASGHPWHRVFLPGTKENMET